MKNSTPKKILIIGNGFDLAHGLPTRYSDFLEFAKRLMYIYTCLRYPFYFIEGDLLKQTRIEVLFLGFSEHTSMWVYGLPCDIFYIILNCT